MGGDGGSIVGRDCQVKQKKKPIQTVSEQDVKNMQIRTCSASNEPLHKPILCDQIGRLYNKQAIQEYQLNKKIREDLKHITSLNDLIECKVIFGSNSNTIICPVLDIPYTSSNLFIVMRDCGCVLSQKSFQQFYDTKKPQCIVCDTPIPLNRYTSIINNIDDNGKLDIAPYIDIYPNSKISDILYNIMIKRSNNSKKKKRQLTISQSNQISYKDNLESSNITSQAREAVQRRKLQDQNFRNLWS